MKISKLSENADGWHYFTLNVGGFAVKNCRWHPPTRRILFPIRYDYHQTRHRVVWAHGARVIALRNLLESGETEIPRDRKPCTLTIHRLCPTRDYEQNGWRRFNFTVRGFTILGCRWHPDKRSIQLPVSFFLEQGTKKIDGQWKPYFQYVKRHVVCAYGAHIVRLRKALEAHMNGENGA